MSPPQPYEIREEVFDAVVRDLLGPAEGPDEEIAGTSIRDRYLVGQLAPSGRLIKPEEYDDLARAGRDTLEEGQAEPDTPQARSLMPSSMGMTFAVDAKTASVAVTATWGTYRKAKSKTLVTQSGAGRTVWKRQERGGTRTLHLKSGHERLVPDEDFPRVVVEATVRKRQSDVWVVTVFLVNGQAAPETNEEEAWLFQPRIEVAAQDESAIFVRRQEIGDVDTADPLDAEERALLDMQYREQVEFGVGHGVAVHAEADSGQPDRALSVATTIVPFYDVPETEVRELPGLGDLERDMKVLADLDADAIVSKLSVLPDAYEEWIRNQEQRVSDGAIAGHEAAAKIAIERCRRALERLREGLDVLTTDAAAADAFRFANRAMYLQRLHSEYALQRRRGKDVKVEDLDRAEIRSWYPFQLAYILIALATITDPAHRARIDPTSALADLLWFPTGGGKTEAYLGLAAYAMGLRRLQGKVGDHDGTYGVAVIMRYTLRLLTVQQFQRASTLMCAMEVIRRESIASGDARWGLEPFRIGLWVGARATPNTTTDSAAAIKEAHKDTWSRGGSGTPYQLTNCPWCGATIDPGSDLLVDRDLERTLTYCSDKFGRCEFSRKQAPREGLPVVVVDEEIYKLLPSLLIGTVDKFAQMPWRGEVANLFGRVTRRCVRHGFLSVESNDSGRHNKKGDLPAVEPVNVGPLRPPELIIQDELHLISGPLGSMVGLYETAIDELSEWKLDGKTIRPKVIASTATIRRARDQIHGLFLRQVEVFPPRGLDIGDNFFSKQLPPSVKHPGRRYFGICAPGRSRPAVLIRVYVALLAAAQKAYQEHGTAADPWMTLVGYFNSLRELGGMRRLVEDDVTTRVFRVERDEDLARPGLAGRQLRNIGELTSRLSSDRIPVTLDWLEERFDPAGDAEREAARDRGEPIKRRPIDALLATNMVSVGVDVRRLGLMVVAGQPKNTAEYIQATSRVGRSSPGLVATVLNWARPRDLSHYERFEHYHATFYQYVEALSVTPFAKRAVDRGLSGLLVSLLRIDVPELTANFGAGKLDRQAGYNKEVIEEIVRRAWNVAQDSDLKDFITEMLKQRLDEWRHEAEMPGRTLVYKATKSAGAGGDAAPLLRTPGVHGWESFTLLNSLRDVEPSINLIKKDGRGASPLPSWSKPKSEESKT